MAIFCLSRRAQDKIKLNNTVNRSGWWPRPTVELRASYLPPKKCDPIPSDFRTRRAEDRYKLDGPTVKPSIIHASFWGNGTCCSSDTAWHSSLFLKPTWTPLLLSKLCQALEQETSILSHSRGPEEAKVAHWLKSNWRCVRLRYIPCISSVSLSFSPQKIAEIYCKIWSKIVGSHLADVSNWIM